MKTLLVLAALTCAATLAHAAPKKAKIKDPAFADTWTQNVKTYAGQKVTTVILDMTDPGAVAENAPCAAIKVTTANSRGEPGGEIIALMPAKDIRPFIQKVNAVSKGPKGNFGAKINYPVHTATFTTLEGENVLVFGDIPKLDGKKPSALLADQQAAAEAASPTDTPKTEEKTGNDKKAGKKADDRKSGKKSAK